MKKKAVFLYNIEFTGARSMVVCHYSLGSRDQLCRKSLWNTPHAELVTRLAYKELVTKNWKDSPTLLRDQAR